MMKKRNYPAVIIVIGVLFISLAVYVGTSSDMSSNIVLPSYNVQNEVISPIETIKDEQIPLTLPRRIKQPNEENVARMSVQ